MRHDAIIWFGVWSLYLTSLRRFFRGWVFFVASLVGGQTLFLLVIVISAGHQIEPASGLDMGRFVGSGLVLLAVVIGAFEHAGADLMIVRMEGGIADELMAPLRPWEWFLARAMAGTTSGLISGVVAYIVFAPLAGLGWHSQLWVVPHLLGIAILASCCGTITGMLMQRWDGYSAVESFLMIPIVYFSGCFVPLSRLPETLSPLAMSNPLFRSFNAVRYGLTGQAEIIPIQAPWLVWGLSIVVIAIGLRLARTSRSLRQ